MGAPNCQCNGADDNDAIDDDADDNDVNDAGADINDADTEVIVPRKEIYVEGSRDLFVSAS